MLCQGSTGNMEYQEGFVLGVLTSIVRIVLYLSQTCFFYFLVLFCCKIKSAVSICIFSRSSHPVAQLASSSLCEEGTQIIKDLYS